MTKKVYEQHINVNPSDYTKFIVTGILPINGRRFRKIYSCKDNPKGAWMTAVMTNLWKGSIFGILPNGKRKVLKRVYN